jgi:hypothetical protein
MAATVEDTSFWEDLFRAFVVIVLILPSLGLAYLAGLLIASLLGSSVAVAAVIVAVTVVFVAIALTLGSIEETENHLLMQNSARYLKNKLMMAELSQQGRRKQFDRRRRMANAGPDRAVAARHDRGHVVHGQPCPPATHRCPGLDPGEPVRGERIAGRLRPRVVGLLRRRHHARAVGGGGVRQRIPRERLLWVRRGDPCSRIAPHGRTVDVCAEHRTLFLWR